MSSFKTRKEWELTGVNRLFTNENERLYSFVESVLFGNYFIIDAIEMIEEDEPDEPFELGRRFFISGTYDALSLIHESSKAGLKHLGIALLQGKNFNDSGDYISSLIDEIIHCKDEAGQSAFIYLLRNGDRIVESLLTDNEEELLLIDSIYKDSVMTNYGLKYLSS